MSGFATSVGKCPCPSLEDAIDNANPYQEDKDDTEDEGRQRADGSRSIVAPVTEATKGYAGVR
jgi:hypothetical protein